MNEVGLTLFGLNSQFLFVEIHKSSRHQNLLRNQATNVVYSSGKKLYVHLWDDNYIPLSSNLNVALVSDER